MKFENKLKFLIIFFIIIITFTIINNITFFTNDLNYGISIFNYVSDITYNNEFKYFYYDIYTENAIIHINFLFIKKCILLYY